jgi:hypothetical protein
MRWCGLAHHHIRVQSFFTISQGDHDYGDTLLKLALDQGKLLVRDYFTPHDQEMLNKKDQDWNGHVTSLGMARIWNS